MKDFTFKIKQNKKENSAEINLEGQLNITNIKNIKEELDKVNDIGLINLNINNVEDIDVAFIQTIEAFKIKCSANKVELNLKSNVNENLTLLLSSAGLQNILINK